MAISWDFDITNVNVTNGRADIKAVRTDDESSLAPQTYTFRNTIIATGPDRASVLNTIKARVEEAATKATTVETFLDGLEQTAKSQMEAWEATR